MLIIQQSFSNHAFLCKKLVLLLQHNGMSSINVGAPTYKKLSSYVQGKSFQKLITNVSFQKGWKILDIGCGTGNNTVILARKVGSRGMVVGTDPIEKRIEVARQNNKFDNIKFYVASGNRACNYGTDFDLVTAGTVMHWIPTEDKLSTFKSIYNSLKPRGMFLFNVSKEGSMNFACQIPYPDHLKQKTKANHFYETEDAYRQLASDSGFNEIQVKEVALSFPFESLDDSLRWCAASQHVHEYQSFLDILRHVCKNNDVRFLYDEQGRAAYKNTVYFVKCIK